jgi:RNA polymerase sigma-70 factor (ECF subfamily)
MVSLAVEALPDDPLDQLAEVVRRSRGALVATARQEGLTPEEALESVQDALSTYLARADRQSKPSADQTIATLVTMVRNAARNHRRLHRIAMPHLPLEACCDRRSDDAPADDAIARAEEVVRLRTCVAELCGVQRAVVMLRLLEERSGEDVAETLGITRGHVDVLVHRAKAALRACMRAAPP